MLKINQELVLEGLDFVVSDGEEYLYTLRINPDYDIFFVCGVDVYELDFPSENEFNAFLDALPSELEKLIMDYILGV